ncbi:MAG: DNA-processing protein DprA [Gammaproteobacteria bacterium]|nr:DNA-processing protein DprA [Gammaproteobacteria bacterium]MBU0773168.1 DNA-processing protein DprA [Gammaproteobacteria bacterium]MBU0855417.1 DNA-processing protein DprA [Gammaproteobacteria bacterium]MBU1848903.1 DNA-processing protein DprA [Gammaproteobacteria bacterium]
MADASAAAWLRLTLTHGLGLESQRRLLSVLGPPERIFAASGTAIAAAVGERAARALAAFDGDADVARALEWLAQPGNHLITLADKAYPAALLEIPDPPTVLYVKGRVELLNARALAIVGARNATAQGVTTAGQFARELSRGGLTIVSGLALGCDAAAHAGALDGPGSTIAVIGTGADRIYPSRNQDLARRIAESGAVVSEFPLGTPALRENFPRRNRIISGLSRGVLVVEAAARSGTLITARLAGDQGREVFAIPGSIHSPLSKGCHQLIRQGAKLVDDARDILSELGQDPVPAVADNDCVSPDQKNLLEAMGFDPVGVDMLAQHTGLTADTLSAMLLALELESRVAVLPDGRFQRIK